MSPASALLLVEVMEVSVGDARVNSQTVIGERVHEGRNEHRFTGRHDGSCLEGRAEEAACFVKITMAVLNRLRCFRVALLGNIDAPRDRGTDEGEADASQGRFRRSAQRQEHNGGKTEKRGGPIAAERRDKDSHDAQGSGARRQDGDGGDGSGSRPGTKITTRTPPSNKSLQRRRGTE